MYNGLRLEEVVKLKALTFNLAQIFIRNPNI